MTKNELNQLQKRLSQSQEKLQKVEMELLALVESHPQNRAQISQISDLKNQKENPETLLRKTVAQIQKKLGSTLEFLNELIPVNSGPQQQGKKKPNKSKPKH